MGAETVTGDQVHEQATGAVVSLEQLLRAFKNIYETMDMVATYKLQALDNMKKTVDALTPEIDKS